jgi:hypothetical protein
VNIRSYWSDPLWKGLRIISFVTVTVTLVILITYFSGVSSWRVPLEIAIIVNIAVFVVLVARSLVLSSKKSGN